MIICFSELLLTYRDLLADHLLTVEKMMGVMSKQAQAFMPDYYFDGIRGFLHSSYHSCCQEKEQEIE